MVQEEILVSRHTAAVGVRAPMLHVLEVRSKVGARGAAPRFPRTRRRQQGRPARRGAPCAWDAAVTRTSSRHLFRFVDADAQGRIVQAFMRAMGVGQDAQETMDAGLRQKRGDAQGARRRGRPGAGAAGCQMRGVAAQSAALRLYLDHEIERARRGGAAGGQHAFHRLPRVRARVVGARAAPWFLQAAHTDRRCT